MSAPEKERPTSLEVAELVAWVDTALVTSIWVMAPIPPPHAADTVRALVEMAGVRP